ncbi:hypothetical protein E2320_012472 [Naja naja]|nr:hypothetical protein E2320_012472 [Naja naja]
MEAASCRGSLDAQERLLKHRQEKLRAQPIGVQLPSIWGAWLALSCNGDLPRQAAGTAGAVAASLSPPAGWSHRQRLSQHGPSAGQPIMLPCASTRPDSAVTPLASRKRSLPARRH